MPISKRATETLAIQSPMSESFFESLGKLHDPVLNPTGALNLGVAHNDLLQQKIFEKVNLVFVIFLPNLLILLFFFFFDRLKNVFKLLQR